MLKAKQKTVSLVVACLATLLTVLFAFAMLFTPTPMKTASAEDTTIVFELGDDGSATHSDGSSKTTSYEATVNGYTLRLTGGTNMYPDARDAMGNGCIKLGASSKTGGFDLTAPDDVTSVIIAIGKYKENTTKVSVNGTAYTLTKNSDDGAYDEITVDTTSNKTISLITVSGGYRAMVNTITYVIAPSESGDPTCEHVNQTTTNVDATCTENGSITVTCEDCGYVKTEVIPAKGHSYEDVEETKAANCTEDGVMKTVCTVCGTEGTRAIPALGHSFVDGVCSECGEEQPSVATLTFDSTEKRTSFSTTQQVWEENGVTLTNDKAGSTTNIADYANPVRFYKSSTITVAYDNMAKIEFACSSASYATSLQKSIGNEAIASDKIVTVTLSSAQDSYTVTLSDGQVRMNSITVYKPAKIDCATITVGENLAVNYYVSNSNADAVMYFTFNGKPYDVTGELQTDGKYAGKYKYTLDNIPPQCMTDNISAVLMNGEVELDKLEEYSIQTYAKNMLNNAESSDELKRLVSDMLYYGAAAQNYQGYKADTESLATYGVENLLAESDAVAPEVSASPVKNTEITSYPVYFTSATVWFDGVNKIRVKVSSIENAFISLDGGETKVALESTTYETEGILATEFDKEFTFQLYHGETLMQTLTYSVNAYAYKMKDHESMGDLAKALYRYGVSAEAYIA